MPGMPGRDDPRERPVLAILTDFGLDGAVAACKGVILGICRDAQIIDVGHSIRKYAISDGAFLLRFALPYVPVGFHIGVVDPGVGTPRRPIGIRTGRGDVLIGPDNGLLLPAADALGGAIEARELTNRDLWLPVTSSTFHGRDIFAPVAAHLASGDSAVLGGRRADSGRRSRAPPRADGDGDLRRDRRHRSRMSTPSATPVWPAARPSCRRPSGSSRTGLPLHVRA